MTQSTTLRGRKAVYVRKCDTFGPFEWLGKCSRMSGVDQPYGDKTITYRHSTTVGQYESDQEYTGAPGAVTSSVIMKETVRSRLYDDIPVCKWDYDIRSQSCGRIDDPFNWDMIKRLCCAEVTDVATDDETSFSYDDEGETLITAAIQTRKPFVMIYRVTGQRVEDYNMSDVQLTRLTIATTGKCADSCGPEEYCTLYAAVTADSPGNPPKYAKSVDGGRNWTLYNITAFQTADHLDDIAAQGELVIAVSHDEGYAYSWDGGVTWGLVDSTVVPEFAIHGPTRAAIQARNLILIGGEGGYVWKSVDGGVSVSVMDEGVVTSGDILDIFFLTDDLVFVAGKANGLKRSINGGDTWDAISMPAGKAADDIYAVMAINENLFMVGYGTTGGLYTTTDGGLTWYADASIAATTKIRGISWCECGVVYAVGQAGAAGVIYRNVDAGAPARWAEVSVDEAGTMYADVACCGPNNAVAVGAPTGIYTAGLITMVG